MPKHLRGLLDTSVVIGLEQRSSDALADENAIAAMTPAEFTAGPHATSDPQERARREDRLQRTEATFDTIPFDREAARAYVCMADFLITATAIANALPLDTRNPRDFSRLHDLLEIVEV